MIRIRMFDHVESTGRSRIARWCSMQAAALVLERWGDRGSAGQMTALLERNREWREMREMEWRMAQIFPGVTGVRNKSRRGVEGIKTVRMCGHHQPCTVPGVQS
jgi:hypothetical protein